MSKKYKKVCKFLNCIEHLLLIVSTVPGCISISPFASLIGIPIGITGSALGLKICVINAGTKKYKAVIKKNGKKQDKIVLLAKSKLNSVDVLFSENLINTNISHDEFAWINNVLKEHFSLFIKLCYCIPWSVQKKIESKTQKL